MSLIEVRDLTFAYDGSYDNIFDSVNFQIDTNWKLGFTGRNGRGKTTFLNLLLGRYPYTGSIVSTVDFEYFPYSLPNDMLPVLEALSSVAPEAEDWQIMRELSLLEVPEDALDRPFHTLSQGERTKALLAALFLRENSFLLIDEPTNHLDIQGRKTLAQYLKRKRGFLLVSHDRAFLDRCIDHILVINRANIEVQRGNFSSWWENRQRQDRFELAQQEKLQKDIVRLKHSADTRKQKADAVERAKYSAGKKDGGLGILRPYLGEKSRKGQQQRLNLERRMDQAIHDKTQLLKNLEKQESLSLSPLQFHSSRLLEVADVSISYQGIPICSDLRFSVEQGDRIALVGKNGCGKSSLLKLIYGEPVPHSGELRKNDRLIISYVSQTTADMKGTLTEYARDWGIDESLFKTILRKLDFSRPQLEKNICEFSQGQKKEVMIARSLCQKAHLYLWDEPLNFIDVISRMQIEQLLLESQPTILFVEHDLAFVEKVSTKTVELHRQKL